MGILFRLLMRFYYVPLIILLAIMAFSIPIAKDVKVDTSFDRLLIKGDPAKTFYDKTINEFGDDNTAIIFIRDENLFTPDNLNTIMNFVWKIEEHKSVVKINSLFTTPHFQNDSETLSTLPLFEDIPETKEEILEKLKEAKSNPLINKLLISKDGKGMSINVNVDTTKQTLPQIALEIDEELKPLKDKFETVFQSGETDIDREIFDQILWAQKVLLPLVIFIISFFIYRGTSSIHGPLISIVVTALSLITTAAFMTLMDIPVQILNSTIPVIIFILGSTEVTHLVSYYHKKRVEGLSKSKSVISTGQKMGTAIFLTAFTTAIGFFTVAFSEIQMLKEFGYICSFSLLSLFISTILYFPIHIKFFDFSSYRKARKVKTSSKIISSHSLYKTFQGLVFQKRGYILIALFSIISLFFASNVETDNDTLGMLKASNQSRKKIDRISKEFVGTKNIYIVLEALEGNFKEGALLNKVWNIHQYVENETEFDKAQSFASQIALINREMKDLPDDQLRVPMSNRLIAQYLLSVTRDEVERYISADYKRTNIVVRHGLSSSNAVEAEINKIQKYLDQSIDKSKVKVGITSRSLLNLRAAKTIVTSQVQSLFSMILVIVLVISFLFLDLRLGLVALPSNLFPILGLFGIMGLLGIPLNIGTCIVAAITIGIAVDDTIHFFVHYSDISRAVEDPLEASQETIKEELVPIVTTSLSLALGLSLLMLSDFVPLSQFGLLSACVLVLAMFSDLVLTPTAIVLFKVNQISGLSDRLFSQLPREFFDNNWLFSGLSRSDTKQLVKMGKINILGNGETLEFSSHKNQVFLVLDGHISLTRKGRRFNEKNTQVIMNSYGPGDLIHPENLISLDEMLLESAQISKVLLINSSYLTKVGQFSPRIYSIFCNNMDRLSQKIS
jgi:uncharacterized protein